MSSAHDISSPEDFAAALTRLRTKAGLSVRDVSRVTDIPPGTLGGYFSGRHLPPPTQPQVLADVLHALGIEERDHGAWREALLRVRRPPGPKSRTAPYRGLEAFDVDHADLFFGREELVSDLVAEVDELRGEPGPHLVFVVGVSGAGKSSLLRAGVLATLSERGVVVATCVPGIDPLAELSRALDGLPADGVLLVDQAEELLGWDQGTRADFLDRLLAGDRVVLLALRADSYARALTESRLLEHLERRTRLVGPMGIDDLARVITEPAVRAGGSVEPELVDLLRRDLAGRRSGAGLDPGVLPLLSHALLATWTRSKAGRLTVTDYLATGGIEGAIRQTAEDVYQGLDEEGRGAARRLFAQLVRLDDDGVPRRRRVDLDHLVGYDEALETAIDAFVRGRILTTGETTVDISHEALLEAWPRLQEWVAEDRDDLRIHRRVHQAARAWDEHGREGSLLMGETLLALAQGLADRHGERGLALSGLEEEFVGASAARQQVLALVARRRQRRTEVLLVAVAVLALVTSGLAIFATQAKNDAAAARDNALSRQIATQAERAAASDPAVAAQLALAAYRVAPTVEARSALLDTTARARVTRLRNPSGPMHAVLSPDGRTLAVASAGKARFWDVATNRLVASSPVGEGGELYAAAYSPDGRTFAAGGGDGALRVFDVTDRDHPRPWSEQPAGPRTAVQTLAFSPDGRELAAATSDPALLRWQLDGESARPLAPERDFGASVQGVDYSPRGGLLATGSSDGRVRLWRQGRLLASLVLNRETSHINSVSFSPDGRHLATASTDKAVRILDVTQPERPRVVKVLAGGFTSWINGIDYSPDGALLAATASGGLTRVWRTDGWALQREIPATSNNTGVGFSADGALLVTTQLSGIVELHAVAGPLVSGYGDNIWAVGRVGNRIAAGVGTAAPAVALLDAEPDGSLRPREQLTALPEAGPLAGGVGLSPDGELLLSGSVTGKVMVWRRSGADWRRVGLLSPGTGVVQGISFSRDGALFLVTVDDGSVALYDAGSAGLPRLRESLDPQSGAVGLALNPAGTLAAVGTFDRQVRVWRVGSGPARQVATLEGFENYVTAVAFSPDGRTLVATAAGSGSIRRWRVGGDTFTPHGKPLRGSVGSINTLVFTPDGESMAGASDDGNVWIWDRATTRQPRLRARLAGLGIEAYAAVFGGGGEWLVAAGAEGRLARWRVDEAAVAESICRRSGAVVTREEWARYVPGAPYQRPC